VGIIPVSDQFDDVLCSADWDFNVGGIQAENSNFRFAYMVLDGLATAKTDNYHLNSFMLLADWVKKFDSDNSVGLHAYYLQNDLNISLFPKMSEALFGATGSWRLDNVFLHSFVILNKGKINNQNNLAFAVKIMSEFKFAHNLFTIQSIYTREDDAGKVSRQFIAPLSILKTEGYWSFSHIFSANGASEVNDLILEIGNTLGLTSRAGLFSIKFKYRSPLLFKSNYVIISGGKYLTDRKRNSSRNVGTKLSSVFQLRLIDSLYFDLEYAYA